jgi:hypothetical protein
VPWSETFSILFVYKSVSPSVIFDLQWDATEQNVNVGLLNQEAVTEDMYIL